MFRNLGLSPDEDIVMSEQAAPVTEVTGDVTPDFEEPDVEDHVDITPYLSAHPVQSGRSTALARDHSLSAQATRQVEKV